MSEAARKKHLDAIIPELEEMTDTVALAAHNAEEHITYAACLKQAKSVQTIRTQVSQRWNEAVRMLPREDRTDDAVELNYCRLLSTWLRSHVSHTRDMKEGGEADQRNIDSGISGDDLSSFRIYASRHLEMIEGFAERHASALDARAEELAGAKLPQP